MYYIIVFNNTYDAMQGEKIMNENGYKFTVMPTPTSITQSCGICLRIEDEKLVDNIKNEKVLKYKNIYMRENREYRRID